MLVRFRTQAVAAVTATLALVDRVDDRGGGQPDTRRVTSRRQPTSGRRVTPAPADMVAPTSASPARTGSCERFSDRRPAHQCSIRGVSAPMPHAVISDDVVAGPTAPIQASGLSLAPGIAGCAYVCSSPSRDGRRPLVPLATGLSHRHAPSRRCWRDRATGRPSRQCPPPLRADRNLPRDVSASATTAPMATRRRRVTAR